MSGHTPGKVFHDMRGYPHPDVRAVSGRKIAGTWGFGGQAKTKEAYKKRTDQDRENARRIVACWNACDGSSTEWLEFQTDPDKVDQFGSEPFETRYSNALRTGVAAKDLCKQLLETLKDAHPHIADDALRARIGDLIVKAEGAST